MKEYTEKELIYLAGLMTTQMSDVEKNQVVAWYNLRSLQDCTDEEVREIEKELTCSS